MKDRIQIVVKTSGVAVSLLAIVTLGAIEVVMITYCEHNTRFWVQFVLQALTLPLLWIIICEANSEIIGENFSVFFARKIRKVLFHNATVQAKCGKIVYMLSICFLCFLSVLTELFQMQKVQISSYPAFKSETNQPIIDKLVIVRICLVVSLIGIDILLRGMHTVVGLVLCLLLWPCLLFLASKDDGENSGGSDREPMSNQVLPSFRVHSEADSSPA